MLVPCTGAPCAIYYLRLDEWARDSESCHQMTSTCRSLRIAEDIWLLGPLLERRERRFFGRVCGHPGGHRIGSGALCLRAEWCDRDRDQQQRNLLEYNGRHLQLKAAGRRHVQYFPDQQDGSFLLNPKLHNQFSVTALNGSRRRRCALRLLLTHMGSLQLPGWQRRRFQGRGRCWGPSRRRRPNLNHLTSG